ncbi:fluoride efflux transporter FluC [Sinomonas sp.]|jgi:CrcB protein|uniref:fluoride efflux transporter FluC n=1 Tax=Sinomonas sp. TaxID=1914986 RepID=UPI002FE11D4E
MDPQPHRREPAPPAPAEPDVDTDAGTLGIRRPDRPLHLHPGFILIVVLGGLAGALARYGLGLALPAPGGWPLPTLVINLAGAAALGILLEALARRGPDQGGLRVARLLAGTGFLGAFTTYSTFAVDADRLLAAGRTAAGIGYLAATLLGGAAAAALGIWAAAYHHARSTR